MNEEKEIKVIHINSPYQIILNCGLNDGVKMNDRFLIYGLGPVLRDPDTDEEIEQLEIVRGSGKVTHIQQKICTIDSIMFEEKPKTIKRTKDSRLLFGTPTEETEIIKEKKAFDEVQVGDRARRIY